VSTQVYRLAGAVAGFALAVVWIAAGFAAAAFCLVAGGLGFAAVAFAQRSSLPAVSLDVAALRSRLERLVRAPRPAPQRRRPPRRAEPVTAEDAARYGW
jgi:uncharacterized membrane protein